MTLSIRSASLGVLIAALLAATSAIAQNRAPANTLMDIRRQFSACLEGTPIETGSVITITFAMKSDGSLLGKPRISYSHFNGDAGARRRFVEDVHHALNSCLPLKITPALGAAIAGQIFFVTIEGEGPQQRL
jgi:hypothetical protein